MSAIVNDHPPPIWRVVIRDFEGTRRIRVVALTEHDALERVRKELPGAIIILIELASQMR